LKKWVFLYRGSALSLFCHYHSFTDLMNIWTQWNILTALKVFHEIPGHVFSKQKDRFTSCKAYMNLTLAAGTDRNI
jgi:hypothetical protein